MRLTREKWYGCVVIVAGMGCADLFVRRKVSPIFIDRNMHIINVFVARETQDFAFLQAGAIVMK